MSIDLVLIALSLALSLYRGRNWTWVSKKKHISCTIDFMASEMTQLEPGGKFGVYVSMSLAVWRVKPVFPIVRSYVIIFMADLGGLTTGGRNIIRAPRLFLNEKSSHSI